MHCHTICCCSLEFLLVAVLKVRSPSAATDLMSYDWVIGYLKVNQLKGCHTQTRRIAPLAKVAVDNTETFFSQW